ncbi:MAG: hypothetical protein FRX49_00217 [Trebouxia sp. A1-2]|nr:MAG: hypothetical protein FRX49_00217 [Trebouxia sp. A1-2]
MARQEYAASLKWRAASLAISPLNPLSLCTPRHLNLCVQNALVDLCNLILGQDWLKAAVFSLRYLTAASWASYLVLTHANKVFKAELLVCHGVVGICVQHDEGERQQSHFPSLGNLRGGEGGSGGAPPQQLAQALHAALKQVGGLQVAVIVNEEGFSEENHIPTCKNVKCTCNAGDWKHSR